MPDSIVVLVVEDDPLIQVVVEEALRDGATNRRSSNPVRRP
jgi:CheY-like chemotaxis protein